MIATRRLARAIERPTTLAFVIVALLTPVAVRASAGDAARRPNIIVIVSDDHGYGDIGVHGCRDIPTPNIDSIAKNGVRCTSGYVSGPYCSPTRAGLLTGRYQQRFGHEFNPGPADADNADKGLSHDETTLPQRLKAAGYATGAIGKWHLGNADRFHPMKRGFDEFFGFLGGSHPYNSNQRGNDPILRGTEPVEKVEYLTDAFGREAVDFVYRHKDEPFFLYLPFNAVHGPMHGADRYRDRFAGIEDEKRRTYATMLTAMDDAIGAVLARVRETGIEKDTLVFFFSDNGGPEPVNASDNGPLRGVKATTWEGGIRVPFLVQWLGTLPAGKVYEQPVIQLDILPTALAAAGVEINPEWELDGVNLLPYFTGRRETPPHDSLYWRFGPQWAIRSGDWKLVETRDSGGERRPLRRGKPDLDGGLLFNLRDDIGEQTDLAGKHPEKVKELQAAWLKWNAELKDPTWGAPAQTQPNQPKKKKAARLTRDLPSTPEGSADRLGDAVRGENSTGECSSSDALATAADDRCVILVSLDGFAHFYVNDPHAHMPTLRRMIREGAVADQGMECSFPTVTWPNHTTLVTGVPPAKHGVLANMVFDREKGEPVQLLIDPVFDKDEIVKAPTIYDVAHKAGLKTAAIVWPATRNAKTLNWTVPDMKSPLFEKFATPGWLDELKAEGIPVDCYGPWVDAKEGGPRRDWIATREVISLLRKKDRPNLILLHLIELDHAQHDSGPRSGDAYWAVATMDDRIRDLRDAIEGLGLRDKVTLIVTSDHGFFATENSIHVNSKLREMGLVKVEDKKVTSKDAWCVSQGGGAAVYITNRERRAEIAAQIKHELEQVEGIEMAFKDPKDFQKLGQATADEDKFGADVWLAAKEGYSFSNDATRDSVVTKNAKRDGTHGYLPHHPEMRGIFIAWGRGVPAGTEVGLLRNTQVAPTMARLLGLEFPSSDAKAIQPIGSAAK